MPEFGPETVFSLAPAASIQSVGDGAVVLLADSGQLFTCNETTEAFLQKVDGKRSFGDILDMFSEEFDVDRATAESDLSLLAGQLIEEKIVQAQ